MKKIFFLLAFLFSAFVSFSQVIPKPNPTAVGIGYKRLLADSTIFIPTGGAIPRLGANNINRRSAIYADSVNKRLWVFYPSDSTFKLPTADTTNIVPYFGATNDVFLGTHGLRTDYTQYSITPVAVDSVGRLRWNDADGTLTLGLKGGNVNLAIGQESVRLVHNNTGSPLTDGQVVYIVGSTGELPSVGLASASSEATSSVTYGMVTESIAHGANGFITTEGLVHGLNTNAFLEGKPIWLSDTAGNFRQYPPAKPSHQVLIGYVVKKAGGNGSIDVKIQNGYELNELHDVSITSVADGDFLRYNSATSLWKNYAGSTLGYVKYTDTASMLIPYLRKADTTAMLSNYYNKTATDSKLALKANDNAVVHLAGSEVITGIKFFDASAVFYKPVTLDSTTIVSGPLVLDWNVTPQLGFAPYYTTLYGVSNGIKYMLPSGASSQFNFPAVVGASFTFPNASGTIALTSNLSSYVPYTGATSAVNLGANAITANNFILNGQTGNTGMYWTSDRVTIANYNASGLVHIEANGGVGVATFGGSTYNNDFVGTGRFTGALSGTSATFSGGVSTTNAANGVNIIGPTGNPAYYSVDQSVNNGGKRWRFGHTGAIGGFSSFDIYNQTDNITALTIASTGAATFSSSVTATNAILTSGGNGLRIYNSAGSNSTTDAFIGSDASYIYFGNYANNRGLFINQSTGASIFQGGNVGIGTSSPNVSGQGANIRLLTAQGVNGSFGGFEAGAVGNLSNGALQGFYGFTNPNVTGGLLSYIGAILEGTSGSANIGSTMIFNTRPDGGSVAEKMRITGNGDILNVFGGNLRWGMDYDKTGLYFYGLASNSNGRALRVVSAAGDGHEGIYFQTGASFSSVTTKMALTSGGNLLVGTTTDVGYKAQFVGGGSYTMYINQSGGTATYIPLAINHNVTSGTIRLINFSVGGTTDVGSITTNGSTTSYNTSSDYRLKEDFKDYEGLSLISAIKTYDYAWKNDKSRMHGVIAHELAEILPYAVINEKDGVKEDGTIIPQGVDYSKIVPILVKAIQELKAEKDALEARLKLIEQKLNIQ